MYKLAMYNTIKTLLDHGKSVREISRELGMCRKTVTRIQRALLNGDLAPTQQARGSALSDYHQEIESLLERDYSALLIHQKLVQQHGVTLSYSAVARYVAKFKKDECYVPLHGLPGEEAQVDFGYFGEFRRNGRAVKVWVFSMVLSYSRLAYFKVVTSQLVKDFLDCHIHAFEYFGGVPKTVKLDNLKSGVTKVDLYEPVLQEQYASFLSYYNCAGITCRPARGQDKGKVESSIKYVKNNFLKAFQGESYEDLVCALRVWNEYGKKKEVTHLACWAHARREFEKALDNDKQRAEKVLLMIQKLYAIESRIKEGELEAKQIKEIRLAESLPIINEMGKWIFEEIKNTLPKSQIGKAMAYAYARWDALSAYLYDGNLFIDNNLVENAIRPITWEGKTISLRGATKRRNGQL